MHGKTSVPQYVLGRSEREVARLIRQAVLLHPLTERIFRRAGIAPGMRVLDFGCGAGDVSFLVAGLVGPTGSVLGVDVNPGVLAVARERAADKGLSMVTFEERSIESCTAHELFDAVVGRFVLMYQADPAATLAHVWGLLRSGGILVVQEPDFTAGFHSSPASALWQRVSDWITETFRRGGVHHDIGGRLYPLFLRAGLPGPGMRQDVSVGGGPDMRDLCQSTAETVRSLLPRIERFGVARAEEVDVDTLAERLERAMNAASSQVRSVPIMAAWATRP
jgi:predicted methyltransferase